jgi:hypothetical protein
MLAIPVDLIAPVISVEELELLRPLHEDRRVEPDILMQARGAGLRGTDDQAVGRARSATSG